MVSSSRLPCRSTALVMPVMVPLGSSTWTRLCRWTQLCHHSLMILSGSLRSSYLDLISSKIEPNNSRRLYSDLEMTRREVAPDGSRSRGWFTLSPIPTMTNETLSPSVLASTKIPPSLPVSRTKSFGHLSPALSPVVASTACLVAFAARNCNVDILDAGIAGLRMMEHQRPPMGDSHFLPERPLPRVCTSEAATVHSGEPRSASL